MPSLSLKTKMTIIVSILVACLLSLMTLFAMKAIEKVQKAAIAEYQGSLATAVADELDYKVSLHLNELVLVARSLPPEVASSPRLAQEYLGKRLDTLAMFDSGIFLFSPTGQLLAGTVPELAGRGGRLYFYGEVAETVRQKAPRISRPYLCATDHRPMVLFSAPVLNGRGEVGGALCGRLDLMKENFLGKLATLKVGKTGYFYLLDDRRTVLVHPDRGRVLKSVTVGRNQGLEAALKGERRTGENVSLYGVPLLSTFRQLKSSGWFLAANIPIAEAYQPLGQVCRSMLAALGCLLFLSVLVVRAAMDRLMAPLISFTRQVATISASEEGPRPVQIDARDEIGGLASAFNRLMDDLARHKQEVLEEKEFEASLLQHSSLPTFVLGKDHRVLHWNNSCAEMTGVPAARVVGSDQHWRGFFDHARPTLADLILEGGERLHTFYPFCEKRGEGYHAQGWYTSLNGMDRYLSFYAAPIRGVDGQLRAVIETVEDITERKHSDQQVRQALSLLNATLESTADGIAVRDLAGRITTYNGRFAELWGLPEELLSSGSDREMRQFVKAQLKDPEGYFQVTEELYTHPERDSLDILELRDGRVFERVSRPQRVENQIVGRVISFRDVTARETAQEAVRESAERYRSLVENTDLGITLIDASCRIVMANRAAGRIFERDPEQMAGHDCFREFKGRNDLCPNCPGMAAMASGAPTTMQTERVRLDGSVMQAKIRAVPVFGPDGKPTGFIEVIQDITDQVQAEAERKLLEAQLRQSQKMEALGTLAGGMAHDFNNILTAIFAYCSLIGQKSEDPASVERYLGRLTSSADRAAALTQSLLAYSRKQPLNPQPLDLNEVVGKVAHLLSRLLGEDIALNILPADGPITVMADGQQLGQVLMNLATNARDAMPEGGTLTIATGRLIPFKGESCQLPTRAVLRVSDTGCGMEEATRERIFEPFFTTKEVGKGTGLGLAVAYGIVKQHDGCIAVSSRPGRGTSFTITLPLAGEAGEAGCHALPRPHPARGSETILLVEDDPDIRATLRELLEQEGYTVLEARDGQEGVDMFHLHGEEIHLLLIDLVMPRKNGRLAFEEMRALKPGIRALFMSGYPADVLDAKGVVNEEQNFLTKPIQIDRLLLQIRDLLDSPLRHERELEPADAPDLAPDAAPWQLPTANGVKWSSTNDA